MLKASRDVKVQCRPSQKNTYGLLPIITCPFATYGKGGCLERSATGKTVTCYAECIAKLRPNVKASLAHNTELLTSSDEEGMKDILRAEFQRFEKYEKPYADEQSIYRIHWAGDIFNATYAKALYETMAEFSSIAFWIYTRSWVFLKDEYFTIPNVATFLSVDSANLDDFMPWWTSRMDSKNLRNMLNIAYMGTEVPPSLRQCARLNKLQYTACPVDSGKLKTKGACDTCRACVYGGGKFIYFKTT